MIWINVGPSITDAPDFKIITLDPFNYLQNE